MTVRRFLKQPIKKSTFWAWTLIAGFLCILFTCIIVGCGDLPAQQPTNNDGVKKVDAQLSVGADGMTAEQRNIKARLEEDNKPGAIKHLYVISSYSGQVILYSTVRGKVTSGGKRLTPSTVNASSSTQYSNGSTEGLGVTVNGEFHRTGEVMQDDGSYGTSGDYLYWWDVRGAYHQLYLTGGQIVTISNQPLPVKSVTIDIEHVTEK